jgi:hypothetical protein
MSAGAVVVVVGALAAADRGGLLGARAAGANGAEWIWLAGDWRRPQPVAFFAVRDFSVDRLPGTATLAIVGDEEYVASLNGWPVGSGRYRQGGPGGRHRLEPLLRIGGNRLVVELRSAYGGGGFLAWIEIDGEARLETGEDWRLFRSRVPGLYEGWLEPGAGEPPRIWGAPPIGRWSELDVPAEPSLPLLTPGAASPLGAARGRSLVPETPWREDWATSAFSPALWSATLLEWPREVEGWLELRFLDREGGGGMLFFAADGASPDPRRAADALIVRPAGQTAWRDAVGRRFRQVLVAAKGRPLEAVVWPGLVDENATRPGPRAGVLGVTPPPLRSPVEEKLRREFEGFAGLAAREPR